MESHLLRRRGACHRRCLGHRRPVEDHSVEDWRYLIDVNLIGVVHGVHTVYPILLEQGFGHIVNTASMAGQVPCPGLTAYAATNSHGCGRPW
ncbi:MAG: SDR family NAD(P)-dependent oxidoreductase [bacterium]